MGGHGQCDGVGFGWLFEFEPLTLARCRFRRCRLVGTKRGKDYSTVSRVAKRKAQPPPYPLPPCSSCPPRPQTMESLNMGNLANSLPSSAVANAEKDLLDKFKGLCISNSLRPLSANLI